jgi:hypothetical protein
MPLLVELLIEDDTDEDRLDELIEDAGDEIEDDNSALDDKPTLDDTPKEDDETREDEICEDAITEEGAEEDTREDKAEDIALDDALSPEDEPPHPLNSKPLAITQGSIR